MDEIIEKLGNFGPFQGLVFTATSMIVTSGVMGIVFMMFGLYDPGWTCPDEIVAVGGEGTIILIPRNGSGLLDNASSSFWSNDATCSLWKKCAAPVYDESSSTIVTEWNLVCDNGWIASLMITIQMCGVLVGSWVCGPLGDRYGRKVSLYSSIAVHAVANLVCVFSSSWQMFTVCRFFIGSGVGGIMSIAYVYPMEFVGNWWRPTLMSVPMWSIGVVQFAVVSYILKDWVHIHLTIAALSAVAFLPVFWMPESMRWLAVSGQTDKIHVIVHKMASWNKTPPVDAEQINKTVGDIQESQKNSAKPQYLDLFRTTRLRKYSIKLGLAWFVIALVYYMITFGVKSVSGNFYTNMIVFSCTEIPCNLLIGPLSNKFGRRFSTCLFLFISALTSFGNVATHFIHGPVSNIMSIVMVTVSKSALITGWFLVTVLSAELYPTVVRNLHSGYLNSICRFGAMVAPYMIPSDDSKLFISFIVAGFLVVVCAALIASVPDSKEMRMVDTVEEMEGPLSKKQEPLMESATKMI